MGTLRERYDLERIIGRGSSGSVWVARDLKLGRPVAIKQLDRHRAEDPEACSRFEREAWTIAQLRSPHIVQVFDAGFDSGVPFIVMELLHGESLEERLARYRNRSRLPLRIAAGIVADVARGLMTSHETGIVHRDLKPGNVFLARENRREIAKLLDFGIASAIAEGPERAELGVLAGTPHFMSPERFDAQGLDGQADLWSLAVMAYQMLTGLLPFCGETLRELRTQVCSATFTAPSVVVPDLDRAVDGIFERAFARVPADRFATAAEFAIALDELAGDGAQAPVARVLFVDDEADIETLLRRRLRREVNSGRYELSFARNGEEALELLSQRPDIDVVFADINMPSPGAPRFADPSVGREGLSFLAQVPEVNPIVRVVMLSAHYENRDYVRWAMNHGAFDFLRKPIDFDDLRQTVEKCAADARRLRQLLEAHQENEVLRGLIGRASVDRLVAEVRSADSAVARTSDASVALLVVPDATGSEDTPSPLFSRLNAHFDLFVPEVHGRLGSVHAFLGDCLLALFQGRDHLSRAIDACLAITERVRMANAVWTRGNLDYSVATAVGSGSVLEGRLGSMLVGRIERAVLGDPVRTAVELKGLCRPLEILVSATVEQEIATQYSCDVDPDRRMSCGTPVLRVLGRLRATTAEETTFVETRPIPVLG